MENLVYRTRHQSFPNWKCLVSSEPFRFCRENDTRSFWRFTSEVLIENEAINFVGFAHPDILFELGDTKLHAFGDCTFSIVPMQFSQVLIIMLYFSKYDLYVPVYFVLMQVQKYSYISLIYFNSFHLCLEQDTSCLCLGIKRDR
jgi:hypothetical protein